MSEVDGDPYRWLEAIDGEDAMAWVRERNAEAVAALAGGSAFDTRRAEIREVLDSQARIPYPTWHGEHLYNLWKDEANPRGLWRRTTLEEYRKDEPDWQVLIDVDALSAAEGENWVWQGATLLRPGYQRCLVMLSRGGSDANVVRELDLERLAFVADGFTLPEAKSSVTWIDTDRIYVGTDFGPGSLTSSGYPRIVKEWRRGTPLEDATVVFEGRPDDVVVDVDHDPTPGFVRSLVHRYLDFFHREHYVRGDGASTGAGLTRVEVPTDAGIDAHRDWLLIRLRSEWTVGGRTYPAGALLVTRFDEFLAGSRELMVLFEPGPRTSLNAYAWTRSHLILASLEDVTSRLEVLTPGSPSWRRVPLAAADELDYAFDHVEIQDTNPDHTDEYLLSSSGFTTPATLRYGTVGGETEALKQEPEFFDATGMSVRQHFATSADATRVPYFVVGRLRAAAGPTLLTGTAGSRCPGPRTTTRSSAVAGSLRVARWRWPTSAAAASTGPDGTGRRYGRTGCGRTRTSPRSLPTWSTVASPREPSWPSRVAATVGCSWA